MYKSLRRKVIYRLIEEDTKVSSAEKLHFIHDVLTKLPGDIPLTGLSRNGKTQARNACKHLQTTSGEKFKFVAKQNMLIEEIRILEFMTFF